MAGYLLTVHVDSELIYLDTQQSSAIPPRAPQPSSHSHKVLASLAARRETCSVA